MKMKWSNRRNIVAGAGFRYIIQQIRTWWYHVRKRAASITNGWFRNRNWATLSRYQTCWWDRSISQSRGRGCIQTKSKLDNRVRDIPQSNREVSTRRYQIQRAIIYYLQNKNTDIIGAMIKKRKKEQQRWFGNGCWAQNNKKWAKKEITRS